MIVFELLKALFYGIVEGITEWLPISSTGHLILLSEIFPLSFATLYGGEFAAEFFEMFEVVIQLGAIAAVAVIFFDDLNPFVSVRKGFLDRGKIGLWVKIGVACMPSAAAGIVLQRCFPSFLDSLYDPRTVAAMLIVYGVLFIVVERVRDDKGELGYSIEDISYVRAFAIGCFQALSIVPGTSRSGATVLGARCLGLSRGESARFSFFMAIPTMLGASAIKALGFFEYVSESGVSVPALSIVMLLIACVSAFAVSLVSIRFLMSYAAQKGFEPFGVYRIILGLIVILYFTFIK